MDFSIKGDESAEVTFVEIEGEVDAYTTPSFAESIRGSLDRGCQHIIVDMERVTYIDSCGLGVLISALKALAERNGSVRVVVVQEHLKRLLSITGLDRLLSVHETRKEAKEGAKSASLHPYSIAGVDRMAQWSAS